jgi:hypothetical protein
VSSGSENPGNTLFLLEFNITPENVYIGISLVLLKKIIVCVIFLMQRTAIISQLHELLIG